jgi:Glycosyl transferase family 2
MKEPTISVAMCTYNGARFLQDQLESIAAQNRLPDELIVCDDCSADETIEIVNAFAERVCFPVRLEINESTCGTTKNFEKAIALCQSEIIALADQDDVWYGHKLKCVADMFLRSPETVAVFSDAVLIDSESRSLQCRLWDTFFFTPKEQRCFANGHALNVLLKHPVVTGATMAFREKFRRLVLPIPANHEHDYWISILLSADGPFQPIPDPLMQYRQHRDQQIGAGLGRLSLMQRVEIAVKAGRQSYLAEVERFRQISERLQSRNCEFPSRDAALKLVGEKILHRSVRTTLPDSRFLRLSAIFRQVANRGYWRYSEGWKSLAKDIFL